MPKRQNDSLGPITISSAVVLALTVSCLVSGCSEKKNPPATTTNVEKTEVIAPESIPATILIEPGSGVGKVRKGMTVDQVIAEIGPPRSTNGNMLVYPREGFWVGMSKDTGDIFNMHLRKGFAGRTPEGLGIGSTREEIIQAHGHPVDSQMPRPNFEVLNYTKPRIRFFLVKGVVDYIVLDLHRQL